VPVPCQIGRSPDGTHGNDGDGSGTVQVNERRGQGTEVRLYFQLATRVRFPSPAPLHKGPGHPVFRDLGRSIFNSVPVAHSPSARRRSLPPATEWVAQARVPGVRPATTSVHDGQGANGTSTSPDSCTNVAAQSACCRSPDPLSRPPARLYRTRTIACSHGRSGGRPRPARGENQTTSGVGCGGFWNRAPRREGALEDERPRSLGPGPFRSRVSAADAAFDPVADAQGGVDGSRLRVLPQFRAQGAEGADGRSVGRVGLDDQSGDALGTGLLDQ
jgi:hypothetical protein